MTWWQAALSYLLPVAFAGLGGLKYGAKRAASDALNQATDEALNAELRRRASAK
jgi:hypothetical protein